MITELQQTQLKTLAKSLGFAQVGFLPVEKLSFRHEFRRACEENRCGNYGASYSCPPVCGTPQAMEDRARRFQDAMVIRSQWSGEGAVGPQATIYKNQHNRWLHQFVDCRKALDGPSLVMSGGCCALCPICAIKEGLPCPHPELAWPCVSAYCVDIAQACRDAGVDFSWDRDRVSFYSIYLIHLRT